MTDESNDRVGHLTKILARGGGKVNDPIFESSNAWAFPGGMFKLRVEGRITMQQIFLQHVTTIKNDLELNKLRSWTMSISKCKLL